MTPHTPKKPSQEWLNRLKNTYAYDEERGEVFHKKTGNYSKAKSSNGYITTATSLNGKNKTFLVHHLVWFYRYDVWPTSSLDHIDGDKTNNHHTNLRQVTQRENIQFYHKSRKTSSKFSGVNWDKGNKKWQSKIFTNGKTKFLGRFECEEEAARAYDRALVGQGLDPVNVKIMRNEERLQKVMEFINDTD